MNKIYPNFIIILKMKYTYIIEYINYPKLTKKTKRLSQKIKFFK